MIIRYEPSALGRPRNPSRSPRLRAVSSRATRACLLAAATIVAILCPRAVTHAATPKTLRTGALVASGTTFCTLVNLGDKTIDVTFTIRNNGGSVVASELKPVAPGQSEQINASIGSDLTRCEFVFSGSPKKVRAAMQLPDGSSSEAR